MVSELNEDQRRQVENARQVMRWARSTVTTAIAVAVRREHGATDQGPDISEEDGYKASMTLASALIQPRWNEIAINSGLGKTMPAETFVAFHTMAWELAIEVATGKLGPLRDLAAQQGVEWPL